jgi:hypothetical protein
MISFLSKGNLTIKTTSFIVLVFFACFANSSIGQEQASPQQQPSPQPYADLGYHSEKLLGWNLHIHQQLKKDQPEKLSEALKLLKSQLEEIEKVVPANAVKELKKVPLWMSPPYPDGRANAEYHPDKSWLKNHGRPVEMAQCVEFTNVSIFAEETRRMPNFALHELAHAYHFRFLPLNFDNPDVLAAYQQAKKSGKYKSVERQDAAGKKSMDQAYALTNQQEYFAELTEAYFSKNDFYPYNNKELKDYDPVGYEMLAKVWGVTD